MSKISMDKVYKTRNGDPVRVLCIDRQHPNPVVALIGEANTVVSYTAYGKYDPDRDGGHWYDLLEVVPEKWHYIIKYPEGGVSISDWSYPSEKAAIEASPSQLGYGTLAGVWKE